MKEKVQYARIVDTLNKKGTAVLAQLYARSVARLSAQRGEKGKGDRWFHEQMKEQLGVVTPTQLEIERNDLREELRKNAPLFSKIKKFLLDLPRRWRVFIFKRHRKRLASFFDAGGHISKLPAWVREWPVDCNRAELNAFMLGLRAKNKK